MFDLGDDLALQTSRIPWLIWIQLLITFLLILLLYSLSIDFTDHKSIRFCASSASPSNPPLLPQKTVPLPKPRTSILLTNTPHITQVEGGEAKVEEKGRSRWRRREMGGGEGMLERERQPWPVHAYFHPCNYFRLARIAFLKCLGLDDSSEKSAPDS